MKIAPRNHHQHQCCSPAIETNTMLSCSSLECRVNPGCMQGRCQGFGTCIVLLTIRQAIRRNRPIQGCTSNGVPSIKSPKGMFLCIHPPLVIIASIVSAVKHAKGMGVPSKYFDFPDASFGSIATVTLKRASRVNPHRT